MFSVIFHRKLLKFSQTYSGDFIRLVYKNYLLLGEKNLRKLRN